MKKRLIIILNFVLFSVVLNAQEILDTAILRCKYTYNHVIDTVNNKGYSEVMILEIGKNICSFYCEKNRLFDSMVNAGDLDYMINSRNLNMSRMPRRNTNIETELYFNYPSGKITVFDKIFADKYEYVEDIESIKWKLSGEIKSIIGYDCRKATCTFRGRDYEVWYTPDIPVNAGVWKFSGLSGLILKITELKNQIQFECISVKQMALPIIKNVSKIDDAAKIISRKEFLNFKRKFYENSAAILNAHTVGSGTDANGNPLPPVRNLPYNPIELE
ncbi:MAG: GLPGLI family protein [Prevotellaceae bacterium]|jgi:GLPGLI family protein|nr:GLPGLI family protein [Prevotellaceae bacterium]